MKQSDIVQAVGSGQATFNWVRLAEGVEVMAWPARIGGALVAVSARAAADCAARLSGNGWVVSLTTSKIEDLIYEHAAFRPEPVLLNPGKIKLASEQAVEEHSNRMLERLSGIAEDALVSLGKNWVLSNGLLKRPGRAANYGLYSSSAPYRSVSGAFRLWQPLSFVHNFDHVDYSQVLRLVRRAPGVQLPSYDSPLRMLTLGIGGITQPGLEASPGASECITQGTLGERCVAWCLEEAQQNRTPNAERIAWYHAVAVRDGRPLGITRGNHCASAQSRAMIECLLPSEVRPHEPRAAAVELQADAVRLGRWHSVNEVRAGRWLPRPGDLALYNRANPGDPSSAWQRHVDRVIRVADDGAQFENIGANEVAGAWNREWTSFEHSRLLGFIAYPGAPPTPHERELTQLKLRDEDVG